jgi:sugar phosphate isomerase/epimerase
MAPQLHNQQQKITAITSANAMKLQTYKTLWGYNGTMESAIKEALAADFNGIEGPAPENLADAQRLKTLLDDSGMSYIAEITTAGSYVPERQASLQDHIDSFATKLEHSLRLDPIFITCLGGCDAWSEDQSIEFFISAMALAKSAGIAVSFETHRSRSLFNPWVTQRIVERLADILLTVDFSHWCVVCERLMDTELDVIHAIADKVLHIHARVGYEQGPQVPDPRAPEYNYALRAHQNWWQIIWQSQLKRQFKVTTMTPEFGPDGYLHEAPFSQTPVANLWELNQWMALEEARHFAQFIKP